jgi:2-hydroxychromene-2-carboxylate isomerase
MSMAQVQFYCDYLSSYAYLAHNELRLFTDDIFYRPFDIRALMPAVGNVPTSVTCKPKNRYIQADLQRWVAHYNVPFQRNPQIRELDSRRLLRATLWAATHGPVDNLVAALFNAIWGIPKPLQSANDVANIVRSSGIASTAIETSIDDPQWDAMLSSATDELAAAGVFGAPTMFVGDNMFFGNDRRDFVRAAFGQTP